MPPPADPTLACQPESYGLAYPTREQALRTLQCVAQGSAMARPLLGAPGLSPYGRARYSGSPTGLPQCLPTPAGVPPAPAGVILHFTAGPSLGSAVRWFCDPQQNSGRSAHLVIARGPDPVAQPALDQAAGHFGVQLPAAAIECRQPTQACVAGAWTNGVFYHIELVGWGCEKANPPPAEMDGWPALAGQRWQPYTARQLACAVHIIRCLRVGLGEFGAQQVWGHEHVQTVNTPGSLGINKYDTGPLLPWAAVRRAVARPGEVVPAPAAAHEYILDGLGYGVGRGPGEGLRVAQYSLGLKPDGVAGPLTQRALLARLADRAALPGAAAAAAPVGLAALDARRAAALGSLVVQA